MRERAGRKIKQVKGETDTTHNQTKEEKGGRTILIGKNLYADHVIRQMPLKVK